MKNILPTLSEIKDIKDIKAVPEYLMANRYSVSMFDAHLNDFDFGSQDIADISVSIYKGGHEINLSLRATKILNIEETLEIKYLKLFFLDNDGTIIGDNIYEVKEVNIDFSLGYNISDVLHYKLKLKGKNG